MRCLSSFEELKRRAVLDVCSFFFEKSVGLIKPTNLQWSNKMKLTFHGQFTTKSARQHFVSERVQRVTKDVSLRSWTMTNTI